ncbi:hypothetical protein [Xanthobacter oligotrophicus]|nr:hypothetical protein [Xanthobacter oligotrophicus]MCG5235302.1 hypothetical protein [Xanthobacter oligotrophicus]
MFDDLIPSGADAQPSTQAPAGGGLFDDLIPVAGKASSSAGSPPIWMPGQGGEAQTAAPEEKKSGAFNNLTAGLNEGIYSTVGAPMDGATWVTNKAVQGINAVTGANLPEARNDLPGSSRWLAGAGEAVGVNDPAKVEPRGPMERILRKAGEGAALMVAPQAVAGVVARAVPATEAAVNAAAPFIGRAASPGALAADAAMGAAGGAGGEVAGTVADEMGGERWRRLAEMAGGIAGGVGAAGVMAVPGAVAGGVRRAADYLVPTEAAQERAAGRRIADAATDPVAVREALDAPAEELIPGSRPTTFQQIGDMGLGGLERAVATKNPEVFQQRRADQNAARLDALGKVQPDGAPEAVSNALRSQLDAIDKETARAIEEATAGAAERVRGMGGDLPPEAYGAALRDLERPVVERAQQRARSAMDDLGGTGTPEGYGSDLRSRVRDAERAARDHERDLWRAVDPDGALSLPSASTTRAARDVIDRMPASARPMEGEERAIFDVARGYEGDTVLFNELTALRSRISTAMREELSSPGKGQTPTYARLSQLRGAVERDIDGAVATRAADDARAVASGRMDAEDSLAATLQRQADAWRARRDGVAETPASQPFDAAAVGRLKEASAATRDRAQTFGASPVREVTRRSGQDGPYHMADAAVPAKVFQPGPKGFEAVGAYRKAVGDEAAMQVLSDYAISDLRRVATRKDGTLDPDAFQRWRTKYRDALRAMPGLGRNMGTAEKASRALDQARFFPEGLPDHAVASRVFRQGEGGFEAVDSFRRAVGDQRANAVIADYAVADLRHMAERPDGTLSPAKVNSWRAKYREALRALPELDAKLADATTASEAIEGLAAARRKALDDFQQGTISRLMSVDDPADVKRIIGGIFEKQDAAAQMRRLARETGGNPEARQGLRKAVADHITERFLSNTEAGTSGRDTIKSDALQGFLKSNGAALRQVLSEQEINLLGRVAADLKRSNRSISSVRLPGGSNTAQDLAATQRGARSLLAHLLTPQALGGAGTVGAVSGFTTGGFAALGTAAALAIRNAGMKRVDELVRDAMLDPELAKLLLTKVPAAQVKARGRDLAAHLGRLSVLPMLGGGREAAPSREKLPEADEPGAAGKARDLALLGSAGVYGALGDTAHGAGVASRIIARNTSAPLVEAATGTEYRPANLMEGVASALHGMGERTRGGVSEYTKRAIANSTPEGDLLKPSTWTLGKNPSFYGYVALAADALGSMLPTVVASVATGGSATAGAVVGGLQGGGGAAREAVRVIDEMANTPASGASSASKLADESAYYRQLRDAGYGHIQAVRLTKAAARKVMDAIEEMPVEPEE